MRSRSGPMPSIGRDRPVQHVVAAPEGAGPFQRQHVERLLHDAQPGVVPTRVEADGALGAGADVEAPVAEHDLITDRDEGGREGSGLGVGRPKQVIRQPLRRLGADAREPRERLDETDDRLDEGRHA